MLQTRTVKRFVRYVTIGGSTFLIDLALLFFFVDILKWQSILAVGTAFLFAVGINFLVSSKYVFPKSERKKVDALTGYLLIAGGGFFFVMGMMYVLVELWHWHYILSRVSVAAVGGMFNYLINLYINFKVVGKDL